MLPLWWRVCGPHPHPPFHSLGHEASCPPPPLGRLPAHLGPGWCVLCGTAAVLLRNCCGTAAGPRCCCCCWCAEVLSAGSARGRAQTSIAAGSRYRHLVTHSSLDLPGPWTQGGRVAHAWCVEASEWDPGLAGLDRGSSPVLQSPMLACIEEGPPCFPQ